MNRTRSATPWPTAQDLDLGQHLATPQENRQRDGDGSAPAAHVGDPQRRGSDRASCRAQSRDDLTFGEFDQQLGLRSRDEGPRIRREGQPEEFLEASNVGNGLAIGAPLQLSRERRLRPGRHRRFGMGQHDSAIDANRPCQQELGVQARCLGAGRTQQFDPGPEELLDGRHVRVRAGS